MTFVGGPIRVTIESFRNPQNKYREMRPTSTVLDKL